MKGEGLFLGIFVVGLLLAGTACGGKKSAPERQATTVLEIDAAAVSSTTGVAVKVLKAKSVGYAIVNRFYWIQVEGKPPKEKLLEIAKASLDAVIVAVPATYHSFTIHFVSSPDVKPGEEIKKCYAKATFLPEGDWQKVGRVPIDGYGAYKLNCNILDASER